MGQICADARDRTDVADYVGQYLWVGIRRVMATRIENGVQLVLGMIYSFGLRTASQRLGPIALRMTAPHDLSDATAPRET